MFFFISFSTLVFFCCCTERRETILKKLHHDWYIQSIINKEQSSKNYSRKQTDLLCCRFFGRFWQYFFLIFRGETNVLDKLHMVMIIRKCRTQTWAHASHTHIHQAATNQPPPPARPKFKTIRGYLSRKSIGSNVNWAHNRKSFYSDFSQSNCEAISEFLSFL